MAYGPAVRPARRRSRPRLRTSLIILVVLAVLLVAADFAARFAAQAEIADQIRDRGFPKKPSVTIEGFPFLTQVASRDISQVRISARDVAEGPVEISDVSAVLTSIHLSSGFTTGTVDRLSGSVVVSYPALASFLDSQMSPLASLLGSNALTLSAAGRDQVRATLHLLIGSASATWRVARLNGNEVNARLVSSNSLPSSLLGPLSYFTVRLPELPLGVKVDAVQVTPGGIRGSISGRDLPFGS